MARSTIFVRRGDRLIARLKHLFYAWRFADQIDARVVMVWPSLPVFWHQFDGTDYSPSLIFNLRDFYAAGGGDDLVFLEGPVGYPLPRRSLRDKEFAAMRPRAFDRAYFAENPSTFYEQDAVVFSFADEPRTREYTYKTLRKLYDRLPHDAAITRSIGIAGQRIGDEQYVGLHVRRGDVDEMLRQDLPKLAEGALSPERLALLMGHYVCRTALNEFYYKSIEAAIAAGQRIVYFSDSPDTMDHFVKTFGRRHFVDAGAFRMRYPIQKAFLDFNLLVGASRIISTGSNYASFAATLGNSELTNVAVAGSLEQLEKYLHVEYLSDVQIGADGSRILRDELEKQYLRRSRMRPLEAEEALPAAL
ncbi:hypothetical protein [Reyranella sp.]|uniref:hypothetical protein n=1 Tax=Reyranella sp. TaxID=1929291 RepID=UPI003C7EA8C4